MTARIRRDRKPHTRRVEELMKSIATSQSLVEQHQTNLKKDMFELFSLMKLEGMASHRYEDIVAEVFRPAGRSTNTIDVEAFQKLVSNKDFLSAVSVSVTKAKDLLPAKTLQSITTTTPAEPKEEQVKVYRA